MIKFIADIGSNHNGDLERVELLIKQAKKIGCWGVKFQLFDPEKLYRNPSTKTIEVLRKSALPVDWIPIIWNICKKEKIKFGCTPFYRKAVEELVPFVDFLKIGSYEILCTDMIMDCANTRKPLMISSGLCDTQELSQLLINLRRTPIDDITILHCVSNYPARPKDCNLGQIKNLERNFGYLRGCGVRYKAGWSDHTAEPGVIYSAVAHGAEVIEFHLDCINEPFTPGYEYHNGHCWLPGDIREVIKTSRIIEQSFGDQKIMTNRGQRMNPEDYSRPFKIK